MATDLDAPLLPYSFVVGQAALKTALELDFIAPRIGGVLASGDRGTAKSTVVRAFAQMMYDGLPVTLPINATDDRVVGGWRVEDLLDGRAVQQPGLLEQAGENGLLYIDEVNLLDDHLVNLILDVSATGILTVQREGVERDLRLQFSLVGTMNPEEGTLRPQLLDRFGLMVDVRAETDLDVRAQILDTVLRFDQALSAPASDYLERGRKEDQRRRLVLEKARTRLYDVAVSRDIARLCADMAAAFGVEGHRGDVVLALAARAAAALDGSVEVMPAHAVEVGPFALAHRRGAQDRRGPGHWSPEDDATLRELAGT